MSKKARVKAIRRMRSDKVSFKFNAKAEKARLKALSEQYTQNKGRQPWCTVNGK